MYLDSAGHAASQRGDAGSSEQVVKEAQSPSLSPPPALLQGLGKSQTPGLKMAGALGPQEERGTKQKNIFTSSAANPCHRPYREKQCNLLPSFICQRISTFKWSRWSWMSPLNLSTNHYRWASPSSSTSRCLMSSRPAEGRLNLLFFFIGYTRCGSYTSAFYPVCRMQCTCVPSLIGALK